MAHNYTDLSDEEMNKNINMIADYIIKTKCSTRKAALYAKEQGFPISNNTVHTLMIHKLPLINLQKYEKVKSIFEANKPKTIQDKDTLKRVLEATNLLLDGFNVLEIAEKLSSTQDIIYDDLTSRLPKIDYIKAQEVKEKLEKNRLNNLQRKTSNKRKKFSDLDKKAIEEFIHMALTYRVSYKVLALIFTTNEEEIKNAFAEFENYQFSLYKLNIETQNESEFNERVAYLQALNYLKIRSKFLKRLNEAKKNNQLEKISYLKEQLKNHLSLVDDSIVNNTIGKELSSLTKEEREAIAKFHLKYSYGTKYTSKILKRHIESIKLLDQELADKKPLFKEKIDRVYDYNNALLESYKKY